MRGLKGYLQRISLKETVQLKTNERLTSDFPVVSLRNKI